MVAKVSCQYLKYQNILWLIDWLLRRFPKESRSFQAGFHPPEIDAAITVLGGRSDLDLQSQQQQVDCTPELHHQNQKHLKSYYFQQLIQERIAVIHQHSMGQTHCNICFNCRVHENVIVVYRLLMLMRHSFGSMKSFVRAMKNDLVAKTRMQSLNLLMRWNDESSCVGSSTSSLKDDRV